MADLGYNRTAELINQHLSLLNERRSQLLYLRRLWGWLIKLVNMDAFTKLEGDIIKLEGEIDKLQYDWLKLNDIPTPQQRLIEGSKIYDRAMELIREIEEKLKDEDK